ncbi:MAG TPA: hypothetical protein VHJ34_10535 [Actinomycetota bacterium]|nr:hypothetical protein [Actinomycetota bacterium]
MRIVALAAAAAAVLAACASDGAPPDAVDPPGPPAVRVGVVRRHAAELAGELPERHAGTQQELAAATYVLGHLQRAGYVARLVDVPVANLVRSTNVVALPPSGGDPEVVVAVPYDVAPGAPGDEGAAAVGVMLELARALRVAEPRHGVELVALGAERGGDRRLGSRRLARVLLDEGADPLVVTVQTVDDALAGAFAARGPGADDLAALARRLGVAPAPPGAARPPSPDVFTQARFDHLSVAGGPADVGRVLLAYLTDD